MVMTSHFRHLFVSVLMGLALFLSAAPGHALFGGLQMSAMGKPMSQSQCQASCGNHGAPVVEVQKVEVNKKETEPQPTDPLPVLFTGVGWTTVTLPTVAYLLSHLRWRPPDLFTLNAAYRF